MRAVVKKSTLHGKVKAIASKSHAHRILIAAALSEKETDIICEEVSADIIATIKCLEGMGAKILPIESGYRIIPICMNLKIDSNEVLKKEESILKINKDIEIDCNESGSTLRFLIPLVSSLYRKTSIILHGRLANRPLEPLRTEMIKHGANVSEEGTNPLRIDGYLEGGDYIIPGNISSQYISGLLFVLPLLDVDSTITITGTIESKSYIEMTIDVISMYGIDYRWEGNKIFIPGKQKYKSPGKIVVEGDWSNIAFWLVAASLNKDTIQCDNLNFDSIQGDKHIVNVIKEMGAKVEQITDSSLRANYEKLKATIIDAQNIPDLVPIIAMLASVADGTTRIINASRLRLKESDRIESVVTTLKKLGADIEATKDGMIINGVSNLKGGVVDSYNDHRIVMMSAIAAMVCEDEVVIEGAEAVDKSYRTFFDDYKKLGGEVIYGEKIVE